MTTASKTTLLDPAFIDAYPTQPAHMNELGAFTAYRTYSRWQEDKQQREEWRKIAQRSVEYNTQIGLKHLEKNGYPINYDAVQQEAEALFDNIFNLRQFLSGRTHWVGGADTGVAEKFPLANFNCSFIDIVKWDDLADLFYLLLVGTGVGFRTSKLNIANLPPIRLNFELIHEEYRPRAKADREELTNVNINDESALIHVGDSKEGWVTAIRVFFSLLTRSTCKTIRINYDSVRPNGEKLLTFGGTASGHESLRDMFTGIQRVLQGTLDPAIDRPMMVMPLEHPDMGQVRPVHILDIGNLIGYNVVVGGVRRTAEINLADPDDWEIILSKYGINGIWDAAHHELVMMKVKDVLGFVPQWMQDLKLMDKDARPMHHRRMSNNSIAFEKKPSREMLNLLFTIMQREGEPGFVNLEAANKRRPNAKGLNPCAEILLDSYGVCNLTTVNVMSFVNDGVLDFTGLAQAQALSTRAGIRMTLLDLELPHWDFVHKRDRLIGTSLTGWQDAMSALDYTVEQEAQLLTVLEQIETDEALKYSTLLRIPVPLLGTTVKPEGTLSQVAGGVSSGIHHSHAPYFIRRIRINANDALVKVARALNWTVTPDTGEDLLNPRTLVVDFPIKSATKKTKDDVFVDEQFDTYFRFQEYYTQHNTSNTIHVRPDEWERCEEIVWDKWDDFIGVSFLAYDGGSYDLAPYEAIDESTYNYMKSKMMPFDVSYLHAMEATKSDTELIDESCADGACAVR